MSDVTRLSAEHYDRLLAAEPDMSFLRRLLVHQRATWDERHGDPKKARVYWDGESWVAEVDHGSWTDSTPFDRWSLAQDHANWLGEREARTAGRP